METEIWRQGGALCIGDPNEGDPSRASRLQEVSEYVCDARHVFDAFRVVRGEWDTLALQLLSLHGYLEGVGTEAKAGRPKSGDDEFVSLWLRVRSELDRGYMAEPGPKITVTLACKRAGVSRSVFNRTLRNSAVELLRRQHDAGGPEKFWTQWVAEAEKAARAKHEQVIRPRKRYVPRPKWIAKKVAAMHKRIAKLSK